MSYDSLELEARVTAFSCLELPGQPKAMHMGTAYLVKDLWRALKEERECNQKLILTQPISLKVEIK